MCNYNSVITRSETFKYNLNSKIELMEMDKEGKYFSWGKVIGDKRQRTVSIPNPDCRSKKFSKYFEVGAEVKLTPVLRGGYPFINLVRAVSSGKQRVVSIPLNTWRNFPIGTKVKIYPFRKVGK